jgi:hypothetical protein
MHRYKTRLIAAFVATVLAAPLVGSSPASAAPAPDGCKNSSVAGAELGHYPAQPAAQSALRVSCSFNNNTGTSMVAAKFHINDMANVQYHNGAARTVTATAAVGLGATTFTVSNCQGITGYVNRGITAVGVLGIPARTFVKSISGACLVTLSNPTTVAMAGTPSFKIDNVDGPRSVVNGTTTNASTTITSPTANFVAATDVGLSVTGTEIVLGTTITGVTNATTATISIPATATTAGTASLSFGSSKLSSTTRQINDAGITSATVINSPASKWNATDIGLKVTGPGIPANTFILSVAGANATTTGGMTITAAPQKVVIGDPSATAPVTGETSATQTVQLDLAQPGSEPCSVESAEGFSTVAKWQNPGSFSGAAVFNTQPVGTKAIGQILFETSVADYSAFVIETSTPLNPNPFSYALWIPNAPLSLVQCPGTATSPGLSLSFGIQAQTASVGALPTGTGRPGTSQLRSINASAYVGGIQQGYTGTINIVSDDVAVPVFLPASEFTRTCIYPAGAVQVNFKCGNG